VHVAHTDHEFVHVSELDQAVDAYVRLATAAIAALPA
jgi:di/tripeptidase